MKRIPAISALAAAFAAAFSHQPAQAAFVLIDNFDSLVPGALHNQGGWVANDSGTNWSVAPSPAGGQGNVAVSTGLTVTQRAYKLFPQAIPLDSTAATLFFRVYRSGPVNLSAGVTNNPSGGLFDLYKTQLNAQHNLTPTDSFKVRDASAFDDLGAGSFANETWYNVWQVINWSAKTYEIWIDAGNFGEPVLAQTHILDPNGGAGDFTFAFRNTLLDSNPLNAAIFTYGNTTPALTGQFIIDDIYIDIAGANLNNPVPEPGTAILGGAGLLGLLMRRRRK